MSPSKIRLLARFQFQSRGCLSDGDKTCWGTYEEACSAVPAVLLVGENYIVQDGSSVSKY